MGGIYALVGDLLDADGVGAVKVDKVEPGRVEELWGSDADLDRGICGRRRGGLGDGVDDGVEAGGGGDDDGARVGGVEDEVAPSEEDFA